MGSTAWGAKNTLIQYMNAMTENVFIKNYLVIISEMQ